MAKKKTELREQVDSDTIEVQNKEEEVQTSIYSKISLTEEELNAAKELQSAFNSHLKTNYDFNLDILVKCTIPTGIDILDTLLGGGFATGLVQIIGTPGSGKSALAAKVIATAQRKYGGLFHAEYMDGEYSTDKKRLRQLGVYQPTIESITHLTIEKIFRLIDGMCTFKKEFGEETDEKTGKKKKKKENPIMDVPWAIAWDSVANTLPEAAMLEPDPNKVTGLRARLLSHLLPQAVEKMCEYNISLVAVNQLRDKIDIGIFKTRSELQYLNKKVPGGQSLLYNSLQILYIVPSGHVKGEYGFHGSRVTCRLIKNKLFTPNIEFDMIFSFERGFSNLFTNFELLKKTKRIVGGGKGWYTLTSCPEPKFMARNLVKRHLEDKAFREAFDNDVKDVLKTEYIDVYTTDEDAIG